jgi:hypothetical protein
VASGLRIAFVNDFGLTTIELLTYLTGDYPTPACPHLPHIEQLFAFPLAQVQRRHAGRVLNEPYDGKLALLHDFDPSAKLPLAPNGTGRRRASKRCLPNQFGCAVKNRLFARRQPGDVTRGSKAGIFLDRAFVDIGRNGLERNAGIAEQH